MHNFNSIGALLRCVFVARLFAYCLDLIVFCTGVSGMINIANGGPSGFFYHRWAGGKSFTEF